jgi:hypothetical protein
MYCSDSEPSRSKHLRMSFKWRIFALLNLVYDLLRLGIVAPSRREQRPNLLTSAGIHSGATVVAFTFAFRGESQ